MLENFIDSLPLKVRSTNWFEEGSRFRKRENAISYRYIELNQLYKKFIALDIDKPKAAFLWEESGLPPPTHVIVNPDNAHAHYLYELLLRPNEVLSRIPDAFILKISHDALRVIFQHDHVIVGCLA